MSAAGDTRDMADGRDLARIIAAETADQSWRKQAACRGADTNLFFHERGENAIDAKAICAGCPVAAQCGLRAHRRHHKGVWGGLTDRELRALRRRRGAA